MDPTGGALVALGTQVAKSLCALWMGGGLPGDVGGTVADLLASRVTNAIEQHKAVRMFDGIAIAVAEKLRKADDPRLRTLPSHEREAAILAVAETFKDAPLDDRTLFAMNLDARRLERHLRDRIADHSARWGLSEQATSLYNLLLRESCTYLLEIRTAMPRFTAEAFTEMLRRQSAFEEQMARLLDQVPARGSMTGDEGFTTDYLRQVAKELDYVDLFGAAAFERSRGYELSVAYISLAVADARVTARRSQARARGERDPMEIRTGRARANIAGDPNAVPSVAVETVLGDSQRVFIRGEAGSGKTTLLQWLAVTATRQTFPERLAGWNGLVPFLIKLRRFASAASLPRPEQFLDYDVAANMAAEMPEGWVHRVLKQGRAIVMVDGVNELPKTGRNEVQQWLFRLVNRFPDNRYVVTSRPAAVPPSWLDHRDFDSYMIEPMTLPDVRQFIAHWHNAVARTLADRAGQEELASLAQGLNDTVLARRELRQLATSPLMCALICALNRDRRAQLPHSRIELFRIALEMFLDRRDIERRLDQGPAILSFTDKQQLLQDLAYWMVVNDLPDAERARVLDQLQLRLSSRRHRVVGTPEQVLEHLLERSGLIREPVVGRIDFVHRSFQEFLAAQAAIEADDVEALVARAPDDQWRQIVTLAAGLASRRQCTQLFTGLLHPPRKLKEHQTLLNLVALACVGTAADVEQEIGQEIQQRVAGHIPPKDADHYLALSRAGQFALDLVAEVPITERSAAIFSTRLAASIAGPAALRFIEKVATTPDLIESGTLVSYWDEFDPVEYADRVLAGRDIKSVNIVDPLLIPGVTRLRSIETVACRCGRAWGDFRFLADLPALRHVGIYIDRIHNPTALDLAVPPGIRSVLITTVEAWRRPASAASSDSPLARTAQQAGDSLPTLRIDGLDSTPLLSRLKLTGQVKRLLITNDRYLRDLSTVTLPPEATTLVIDHCREFRALDGAEHFARSRLRHLVLSGLRNRLASLQPLLEPYRSTPRIVDQLDSITISYTNIPAAEVGDPTADLAPYGFHIEIDAVIQGQIEFKATRSAPRRA